MNILGKKSLAAVMKLFFELFMIVWIIFWTGLLIFLGIRFSNPTYPVMDLPIYHYTSIPTDGIKVITPGKELIDIQSRALYFRFQTERDWETIVLSIIGILSSFIISLWALWLVRNILVSLVKKNPFIRENVRRFRMIALLAFIVPVLGSLWGTSIFLYIRTHFSFSDSLSNPISYFFSNFDWKFILFGFLILIMAEIFRLGMEYREDSQSIV
jgi:hypothetical protein